MKIVIAGYPRSGKSTLANILLLATENLACDKQSTDSLLETKSWSDLSKAVSEWFNQPGPWIIEGVACARAVRKWHLAHPDAEPPFDMFIYIRRGFDNYLPGQRAMAKGSDTVMTELWSWMFDKCLVIELGPPREEHQ